MIGNTTSSSRSTMRRGRSTRPSWSRRKEPPRAFSGSSRRSPRTACSGPSIPIADRTISIRRKPAARSTNRNRRRSGAPWRNSASPTSRPIRPRRAAAWSGCSAPCRAACHPSCGSAGDRHGRGRQPLSRREQFVPDLQRPLRGAGGRGGLGVHPLCRQAARRHPVHSGEPPGGARQLRQLERGSRCRYRRSAIAIIIVRATVRVHQYPDGRLAIFDGPSCLARFDPDGKPIDVSRAA